MAGTVTVFDEAKLALLDGTHDLDTHTLVFYVLDNTTTPTAAVATPNLSDFTQVGGAGSYSPTTLTISLTETSGVVTFDSSTNPTYAQNASNDTDAYWGLIANSSASNAAICWVDLGGPVDMTAGSLTITWNGSGVFTLS